MKIKKEIEYSKEIGDVFVLFEKLTKTIKSKGDYLELMPALVEAVNKVDEVDDEFKEDRKVAIQTATYHLGGIVGELLPQEKKAEEPA